MTIDDWFARMQMISEDKYLASDVPWHQSGFSGSKERWETLRRPVADCIERSGSFLDIGCANGYLLECLPRWVEPRGIQLELYGLDISEALVAIARSRQPHLAVRMWVANAASYTPPRRFDYVRTELVYVPADRERAFIAHLLERYVAPGGCLLVANYLEDAADPADAARRVVPGASVSTNILERLRELGYRPVGHRDGFDPVKGRQTRVAILPRAPE